MPQFGDLRCNLFIYYEHLSDRTHGAREPRTNITNHKTTYMTSKKESSTNGEREKNCKKIMAIKRKQATKNKHNQKTHYNVTSINISD